MAQISERYEEARAFMAQQLDDFDLAENAEELRQGDLMRMPTWVVLAVVGELLPQDPAR